MGDSETGVKGRETQVCLAEHFGNCSLIRSCGPLGFTETVRKRSKLEMEERTNKGETTLEAGPINGRV